MPADRIHTLAASLLAVLALTCPAEGADAPLVAFDVPFTLACRDVTPMARRETYQRKIIEAVVKISPQLLSGEEGSLKRLHYEISSDGQMPVLGYLPSAAVATDVVDGHIAIQASEHHGNFSFRYLILPGTGDGEVKGDLESSRAQYTQLAPKQLLMAAGTIQRGYGVYFDLRPSKQDTLQKQREFACLFEVPKTWRADYLTVQCRARTTKRGLAGLGESEVDCGAGMLCVGLYVMDDEQARAYAEEFARKQQRYFDRLAQEAQAKPEQSGDLLLSVGRLLLDRTSKTTDTQLGASLAAGLGDNKGLGEPPSVDALNAARDLDAAKEALRKLNGN